MSEMLERVARAIEPGAWGDLSDALYAGERREDSLRMARAAIDAMREPTTGMLFAVKTDESIGRLWSLLIDEALTDKCNPPLSE